MHIIRNPLVRESSHTLFMQLSGKTKVSKLAQNQNSEISSASSAVERAHECFWCKNRQRSYKATRNDGMSILSCQNCKLNSVAKIGFDMTNMYGGSDYFESMSEYGYNSYETSGIEHWYECLFAVLMLAEDANAQKILDLGCATGSFLDFCKYFGLETCGMELSDWASQKCSAKGHRMVASTLDDLSPTENFELLTAFHLLEHLENPREFLEKIAGRVSRGSKFFATFPNVDFQETNWSGFDSSFEHISYFDPEFVAQQFSKILGESFLSIGGIGQIYCFAGKFSDSTERILRLASQTTAPNCEISQSKIIEEAKDLTATELVFITAFVARNHSASRAAFILECLESKFCSATDANWILLCKAFIHLQNGNVFGVASFLEKISTEDPALVKLRDTLSGRLDKLSFQNSNPKISVVLSGCVDSPTRENFFHSIGSQTYPNIEILHLTNKEGCLCRIPESYKSLIKFMPVSSIDCHIWDELKESAHGKFFLWTDGSLILSPFCLYALYENLLSHPDGVVIPKIKSLSKHYFGKRTIEKLLGTQFTSIPPLMLLKRDHDLLKTSPPQVIGDSTALQSVRKKTKVSITQDVLAW